MLREAGAVVIWTAPEQPQMLECPLLISSPWSPHCTWGCCEWRGKKANRRRRYRGWRRVRNYLCCWTPVDCWSVRVRGRQFWRSNWESWSDFRDRDCFRYSWTTDLLVMKLLKNPQFFIRVSHWPAVPSVKLVFMCAQISRSWLRHRVVF